MAAWLSKLVTLLSILNRIYGIINQKLKFIPGCEHIIVPPQNLLFEITNKSLVVCGIQCFADVKCNSVQLFANVSKCYGTDVTAEFGCASFATSPVIWHYEELCLNGGYITPTGGCKCVDGWVGYRCQRLMKSCKEGLIDQGYKYDTYWVQPTGAPSPFRIRCMNNGAFKFMQRFGLTPLVDFNRDWNDYKYGFGDPAHDSWLGLEGMHYLTHDGLKYAIFTHAWLKNGTVLRSRQANFKVGHESTNFKLDFTHSIISTGDILGNCLEALKGQPFTTYDRDNDNAMGKNCAQERQGGYWFSDCGPCNPTGLATQPASGLLNGDPWELSWTINLGNIAPYKIRHTMNIM